MLNAPYPNQRFATSRLVSGGIVNHCFPLKQGQGRNIWTLLKRKYCAYRMIESVRAWTADQAAPVRTPAGTDLHFTGESGFFCKHASARRDPSFRGL
jgi:hypothetical protein